MTDKEYRAYLRLPAQIARAQKRLEHLYEQARRYGLRDLDKAA